MSEQPANVTNRLKYWDAVHKKHIELLQELNEIHEERIALLQRQLSGRDARIAELSSVIERQTAQLSERGEAQLCVDSLTWR